MIVARPPISALLLICSLIFLPPAATAESAYLLPMCKIIDEREPSEKRTELLEHCDDVETVLRQWFADASANGLSDEEAADRALTYIVTAHWLRLIDIESAGETACGDGTCDEGETAQSCPEDCPADVPGKGAQ